MLVFVIPLKSPQTAASWNQVCKLFERCVRSICNQTDANFQVVVVCNQKPTIQFEHDAIHYLEVDFSSPGTDREQRRIDKAKKIMAGLIYARQFNPNHVMLTDADDCVSRFLAQFTNQQPQANGWFVSKGFVYQENSPLIYHRKSHFHRWCGTCNIIRFDLCPLPQSVNEYPAAMIAYYNGKNHRNIEIQMQAQGLPLQPLPFSGAVYVIGNGENIYQTGFSTIHNSNRHKLIFQLKELLKFRPLTRSIRTEFGLYHLT